LLFFDAVYFVPFLASSLPQKRIGVKLKKELNISCEYHGYPTPAIHWKLNGIDIEMSNVSIPFHLTSNTISRSEISSTFAIYNAFLLGPNANISCWANNSFGTTDTTTFALGEPCRL